MLDESQNGSRIVEMLMAAHEIEEKVLSVEFTEFLLDEVLRFDIIRLLIIIGNAAERVTEDFRLAYPDVWWSRLVEVRDALIEGEEDLEADSLYEFVTHDLFVVVGVLEQILGGSSNG